MNELKIFENQKFGAVRILEVDSEVWFVGKDIADTLGYQNGSRDINRHVHEEDRRKSMVFDGIQNKETILINESGLYSLILSSKLESAKEFKRWVTLEVLPSIRKYGLYAVDEILENPDMAIAILTKLKEEREARKALEQEHQAKEKQIGEMAPKALFADAVSASEGTILIGELAKILKGNGVEIGQNRLFAWLRERGYLIKRKGTDYNAPTQVAMELGLFKVKETAITHSDGHVTVNKTTKVTGKGQQYLINKLLAEKTA